MNGNDYQISNVNSEILQEIENMCHNITAVSLKKYICSKQFQWQSNSKMCTEILLEEPSYVLEMRENILKML